MDFVTSQFAIASSKPTQKWGQICWKSVQLVKGSSFRNDLLQNPYFKQFEEKYKVELAAIREKERIERKKRMDEELERREMERRELERSVRKSFYVPYAHTIMTHGLYIFYPIFHCGLYCRAVKEILHFLWPKIRSL